VVRQTCARCGRLPASVELEKFEAKKKRSKGKKKKVDEDRKDTDEERDDLQDLGAWYNCGTWYAFSFQT